MCQSQGSVMQSALLWSQGYSVDESKANAAFWMNNLWFILMINDIAAVRFEIKSSDIPFT